MPRHRKRNPGGPPPEAEFTPAVVHAIFAKAVQGDRSIPLPEVGHLSIVACAEALSARKLNIAIERSRIDNLRRRERLAEYCRDIAVNILPNLQEELGASLAMMEDANPDVEHAVRALIRNRPENARPVFRGALRDLDMLAAGVAAVSANPLLLHPMTRLPPIDFWEIHADDLADLFNRTVARTGKDAAPIGNPLYIFLVEVVPMLTGERVTFEQVRSHFMRKRPAWPKHRRPRKR